MRIYRPTLTQGISPAVAAFSGGMRLMEQAIGVWPPLAALPWGTLALLFFSFWLGTIIAEWKDQDFWLRRNFQQFFDLCEFFPVTWKSAISFEPGPAFSIQPNDPTYMENRQFLLIKLPYRTLRASKRIRFRIRVKYFYHFQPSQILTREWVPEMPDVLPDSQAALMLAYVCCHAGFAHFFPIRDGENFISFSQGFRALYTIQVFEDGRVRQTKEIMIHFMDRPGQFYCSGATNTRYSDGGKFFVIEDSSKPLAETKEIIRLLENG